jgi:hypothetical protein
MIETKSQTTRALPVTGSADYRMLMADIAHRVLILGASALQKRGHDCTLADVIDRGANLITWRDVMPYPPAMGNDRLKFNRMCDQAVDALRAQLNAGQRD